MNQLATEIWETRKYANFGASVGASHLLNLARNAGNRAAGVAVPMAKATWNAVDAGADKLYHAAAPRISAMGHSLLDDGRQAYQGFQAWNNKPSETSVLADQFNARSGPKP